MEEIEVFLIEDKNYRVGNYQVFKKIGADLSFVFDLQFLKPIIEFYKSPNGDREDKWTFDFYTPLINALQHCDIKYRIKDKEEQSENKYVFIINKEYFNKLAIYLHQTLIEKEVANFDKYVKLQIKNNRKLLKN